MDVYTSGFKVYFSLAVEVYTAMLHPPLSPATWIPWRLVCLQAFTFQAGGLFKVWRFLPDCSEKSFKAASWPEYCVPVDSEYLPAFRLLSRVLYLDWLTHCIEKPVGRDRG